MVKPVNKTLQIAAMSGGVELGHVSGPIASFRSNGDPLRSLLANIDPVQEGTGDPSPDNVRPISGWSAVNVWRTGKNLSSVSGWSGHTGIAGVLDTPIPPNTEFTMSGIFSRDGAATNGCAILFGFSDGTNSGWTNLGVNSGRKSATKTYTKEIVSVNFYSSNVGWADSQNYTLTAEEFQIELGSTATPYEPYSGNQYTTQLGQTVYGGTLDVLSGVLRVDRAMVDLGTLDYFKTSSTSAIGGSVFSVSVSNVGEGMATRDRYAPNTMISSMFTTAPSSVWWVNDIPDLSMSVNTNALYIADNRYADAATFKAAMSGVQLVYELATPITIPLSDITISTLAGQNVMWADCGDVDVTYVAVGGEGGKLALLLRNRKELLIAMRKGLSPAEVGLLSSTLSTPPSLGNVLSPGAFKPGLTPDIDKEEDDLW